MKVTVKNSHYGLSVHEIPRDTFFKDLNDPDTLYFMDYMFRVMIFSDGNAPKSKFPSDLWESSYNGFILIPHEKVEIVTK